MRTAPGCCKQGHERNRRDNNFLKLIIVDDNTRSRRDQRAFAPLFDRHGDAVFRYTFTLTRNADPAQDLLQESFITAWKKLADIRLVGDSMLPWLLVACRNHNANRQRSRPSLSMMSVAFSIAVGALKRRSARARSHDDDSRRLSCPPPR